MNYLLLFRFFSVVFLSISFPFFATAMNKKINFANSKQTIFLQVADSTIQQQPAKPASEDKDPKGTKPDIKSVPKSKPQVKPAAVKTRIKIKNPIKKPAIKRPSIKRPAGSIKRNLGL